jgi:hypothetical protein
MPEWAFPAAMGALVVLVAALVLLGLPAVLRPRDPDRCRVSEETGGYFIGRQNCHTHNIVWDDGGTCPRRGESYVGQPFAMTKTVRDNFPGRY